MIDYSQPVRMTSHSVDDRAQAFPLPSQWAYAWEGLAHAVRHTQAGAFGRDAWWFELRKRRDIALEAFELAECERRAREHD